MTSLRHNPEPESQPSGAPGTADAYLDAARDCILDVGWKRTTLTEVARRAGVSRMTIYRTWADMPTLLGDLMTREWGYVVATTDGVDGLVPRLVAIVRALRENELFVRILEVDPELVLPYLLARRGRSQEHVIGIAELAIRAGQADGTVRAGNPTAIARTLMLTAQGFVLSAHTMVDDLVSEADLDTLFAELLSRGLRP